MPCAGAKRIWPRRYERPGRELASPTDHAESSATMGIRTDRRAARAVHPGIGACHRAACTESWLRRADERYGLDAAALGVTGDETWPDAEAQSATAPLNGIWRSTYEYESSGRGGVRLSSSHYVMLIQQGAKVQVRSLPATAAGQLIMDLTVNGAVLTGNWSERTDPGGYYQGSVYHGSLQMLLEPSGRKMAGKWCGLGAIGKSTPARGHWSWSRIRPIRPHRPSTTGRSRPTSPARRRARADGVSYRCAALSAGLTTPDK